MHYPRNLSSDLIAAIKTSPVVLLNGARQSGKSTIVQALATRLSNVSYITFDDPEIFGKDFNQLLNEHPFPEELEMLNECSSRTRL